MRVGLIISQPFYQSIGTDVRINGLAVGLAKIGVEVTILSPFPVNEVTLPDNIVVKQLTKESSVLFSKTIYGVGKRLINSKLSKIIPTSQSYLIKKVAKSLAKDIEVAVNELELDLVQAEQEIAALSCVYASRKLSIPIVADFHGIWIEELIASGLLKPNSLQHRRLLEVEKKIAKNVDAVLVVSGEMKSYVVNKYDLLSNQVHVIPNGAFPRSKSRLFESDASKVVYAGTLTMRENMPLLLHSFSIVSEKYSKARFYMSNKGDALDFVKAYAKQLHVTPTFTWFDDFDSFYKFLGTCHVGVIPALRHKWRQMATPAKLYDYLSVGLPVVSVDISASWNEIIRKNKVGILTEDNPKSFAEAILTLLKNPELVFEYGNRAIQLVKTELNYQKSAEQLKDVYDKLI